MKEKRKHFYLDDVEHRLLVGCLMTARNEYIHENKPIEAAGKRTCRKRRHHRNTQSGESNTMGAADERSTGNSNGDHQQ